MSQETFQMICNMNMKNIETQVVLQCAPVLMDVKISNLLMVPTSWTDELMNFFRELPLAIIKLYEKDQKTAFLVFRPIDLLKYLEQDETTELMRQFGYRDMDLDGIVGRFTKRYEKYLRGTGAYPHEIGLMLGYPVEDVTGFIIHQGKNCTYSGYWKVYGNVAEAVMRFKRFDKAKEVLIHMLCRGIAVADMVK